MQSMIICLFFFSFTLDRIYTQKEKEKTSQNVDRHKFCFLVHTFDILYVFLWTKGDKKAISINI